MPTIRVKHQTHYTVIQNDTIRDKQLTWKARGLLCFLLSYPDNWELSIAHLEKKSPDGREAVRSGLIELEKHGYLKREKKRVKGKFQVDYIVYEIPQISTESENSTPLSHQDGLTATVQPHRINRNGSTASDNHPQRNKYYEVTSDEKNIKEITPHENARGTSQESFKNSSQEGEGASHNQSEPKTVEAEIVREENNSDALGEKSAFTGKDKFSAHPPKKEYSGEFDTNEPDTNEPGTKLSQQEADEFWVALWNYKLKTDDKMTEGRAQAIASKTLERLVEGQSKAQDRNYLSMFREGLLSPFCDDQINHQNYRMAKAYAAMPETINKVTY
jgi:hypothetical protein